MFKSISVLLQQSWSGLALLGPRLGTPLIEEPLPKVVSEAAIMTAINFVEVCCQHTAYISGRGSIDHELELIETGDNLIEYINLVHAYSSI